jgi:hypothetical protein
MCSAQSERSSAAFAIAVLKARAIDVTLIDGSGDLPKHECWGGCGCDDQGSFLADHQDTVVLRSWILLDDNNLLDDLSGSFNDNLGYRSERLETNLGGWFDFPQLAGCRSCLGGGCDGARLAERF